MSSTLPRAHSRDHLPEQAPGWAFFLDVDGTLLEIKEHPELARPTPRIKSIVQHLQLVTQGAVALISGRSIETLDEIFLPLVLPAAGLHGLQRRDARGHLHTETIAGKSLDHTRQILQEFCRRYPGTLLEDKGMAIAVHYRNAPAAEGPARSVVHQALEELGRGFEMKSGKMVFEIRPAGDNKGSAIADFMREAPFQGRLPVFIGDDVTDEDGFDMVNHMGGYSIRVGDHGKSNARYRIPNVEMVLHWLEEYHYTHWQ